MTRTILTAVHYADGRVESRRLQCLPRIRLIDDPRASVPWSLRHEPRPVACTERVFEAVDFRRGDVLVGWCYVEADAREQLEPRIAQGAEAAEALGRFAARLGR